MLYYVTDEQLNNLFQAVEESYGPQSDITIQDIPSILTPDTIQVTFTYRGSEQVFSKDPGPIKVAYIPNTDISVYFTITEVKDEAEEDDVYFYILESQSTTITVPRNTVLNYNGLDSLVSEVNFLPQNAITELDTEYCTFKVLNTVEVEGSAT